MGLKICAICNKEFYASQQNAKYCCIACKKNAEYQRSRLKQQKEIAQRTKEINCQTCGKVFSTSQTYRKFCSKLCMTKSQDEKRKNKNKKPDVIKQCIYCGKDFKSLRSTHLCCSYECRQKVSYTRKTTSDIFKYPNGYFQNKTCRRCGSVFTPTTPSQFYCSRDCKGKDAYYKRVYGISENEYNEMLKQQESKCFICGSPGFIMNKNRHTAKLVVDHCHASGTIGKLLCHNCNRALGLLKDDAALLRKAANYLDTYRNNSQVIPDPKM